MLFNLNSVASYTTVNEDVNTTLQQALVYFKPGFAMRDNFTFNCPFGEFLVLAERQEIVVDAFINTKVHRTVAEVICTMFLITYSKFHGYSCEELVEDLQQYTLLLLDDVTVIHDLNTDKVYIPDSNLDGIFSIEIDMRDIDSSSIKSRLSFDRWVNDIEEQVIDYSTQHPYVDSTGDQFGDVWEGYAI